MQKNSFLIKPISIRGKNLNTYKIFLKTNEITQYTDSKDKTILSKKRLEGISFARACCCLGIVIFHYFCHSRGNFKLLFKTANSSFGFIFVTAFFNISGACLYYNYPIVKSKIIFYFKRWKSIFPPYYLCYLYFYIELTIRFHGLLFKKNLSKIYFTILGLDGYLLYKIKTCYLIGEWFLGAIIIIYLIYPFIAFIYSKNYYISFLMICILNISMYYKQFFIIDRSRNIITCITSFYFGMTTIKFKKYFFANNNSFLISLIIFIVLSTVKIYSSIIIYQMQGFSLFIILTKIGKYLTQKKYERIFIKISNLSYSIYLLHHRIIIDILSVNNPFKWYSHILVLSLILLLILIYSKIHSIVVDSFIKSNFFQNIESLFI